MNRRSDRKQQILEVLAQELESKPGSRVTTASLARAVGVSEAALYRHFASKAKMFEALIEFAEDTVFGLIHTIVDEHPDAQTRCQHVVLVALRFAEKNPGIARILLGDAIVGENERLRLRVRQFFARLETELRQICRTERLAERETGGRRAPLMPNSIAGLLMNIVVGKIDQFVRSDFEITPTTHWEEQWQAIVRGCFVADGETAVVETDV